MLEASPLRSFAFSRSIPQRFSSVFFLCFSLLLHVASITPRLMCPLQLFVPPHNDGIGQAAFRIANLFGGEAPEASDKINEKRRYKN
jgi:hypothetical protein